MQTSMRWTAAALAGAFLWAAPGAAAEPAAERPDITVSIDNDRSGLTEGESIEYRIRVGNHGTTGFDAALVSQMLPQGLTIDSVEPAAARDLAAEAVWIRELPAGEEITLRVQATVGALAEGRTDLTTTACVLPDGQTRPAFCDSDSDPVAAPVVEPPRNWWGLLAFPLLVVLGLAAAWWLRRPSVER